MAPNLDLDMELRLAVFEHVARLRDAGGGLVASAQLNEGIIFRGERVPLWNYQKGIFKPKVLGRHGAALSFQTSFKDPYEDEVDREDERFVYRYRGEDAEHADNRAMRRAMDLGRPLLYLVGIRPGTYEPIFPCNIVGDDPGSLSFFVLADAQASILPSVGRPEENEPLKAYVTRAVKQRLHQQRFRYLVLRAYREQCAMCRLRKPPLLDAAHILPDRDARGRPEVPNGLSLCKIHHAAYDADILGVDPDYRIHVSEPVLREVDGPMLVHGLQDLESQRIQVPRRGTDRPNRDFLAERFERFRAA